MKRVLHAMLALFFTLAISSVASAGGEHGGIMQLASGEHGGKAKSSMKSEMKAEMKSEPTKDDIRNTMTAYVASQTAQGGGTFNVNDPDTGKTLKLTMLKVHERIGKTGDYYYSCADFKDASGQGWDLDLDVENKDGMLSVVDVRVHKEDGERSYTYDDEDNRIPVKEGTKRHLGSMGKMKGDHAQMKGSARKEMKSSSKEHGGG
ncbi:hypothetical protein MNBD_BACTEROID05-566 [hydrothermal vent metagenome]|uniref:Uncharacterized protein n=1 Tax=hydrothermal vent metagenome TaxID=652676 RepID=A0A3B0T625_9ZZZZ